MAAVICTGDIGVIDEEGYLKDHRPAEGCDLTVGVGLLVGTGNLILKHPR